MLSHHRLPFLCFLSCLRMTGPTECKTRRETPALCNAFHAQRSNCAALPQYGSEGSVVRGSRRAGCRLRRGITIRPRKIAAARAYLVALVLGYFDADLVIAPVQDVIRRKVGDRILVAQLVADVLKGLVEIVDMVREKRPAASFFGKVLKNFVAFRQMIFAVARFVRVGFRKRNTLRAGADRISDHAC